MPSSVALSTVCTGVICAYSTYFTGKAVEEDSLGLVTRLNVINGALRFNTIPSNPFLISS